MKKVAIVVMNEEQRAYAEMIAKGLYQIAVRGGPAAQNLLQDDMDPDGRIEEADRYAVSRLAYMISLLVEGKTDQFNAVCAAESCAVPELPDLPGNDDMVDDLEKEYDFIRKNFGEETGHA